MSEGKLTVDMNNLHVELARQPEFYHEWADKLASARAEKDRLEGLLKLTEAQLDSRIRATPNKFGLVKITEPSVEKAIILSERYQDVQEELNRAKESVYHLSAMVQSVGDKKDVISDLVKLALADYFSTPNVPRDSHEQANDALARRVAGRSKKG